MFNNASAGSFWDWRGIAGSSIAGAALEPLFQVGQLSWRLVGTVVAGFWFHGRDSGAQTAADAFEIKPRSIKNRSPAGAGFSAPEGFSQKGRRDFPKVSF
jgi:hypothetical protein